MYAIHGRLRGVSQIEECLTILKEFLVSTNIVVSVQAKNFTKEPTRPIVFSVRILNDQANSVCAAIVECQLRGSMYELWCVHDASFRVTSTNFAPPYPGITKISGMVWYGMAQISHDANNVKVKVFGPAQLIARPHDVFVQFV